MGKEVVVPTLIFILFLFPLISAQILINEVMPNPSPGTNEWLEIYNPENLTLNLSEWKIGVNNSNYSFSCNGISPCSLITNSTYFLLISKKANISQITNLSVTYYNSSYIYTFPNDVRIVYLYHNENIIDSTTYPLIDTNITWARLNDSNNDTFIECAFPSPGSQNRCSPGNDNPDNPDNPGNDSDHGQDNETDNETDPMPITPQMSFSSPSKVYNNKTNFTITLNLINFSQGSYDIKIDIKNTTKYLNRFWTSDGWSDKNSWIDNFIHINITNNSTNFTQDIINIIDTDTYFVGNASIQVKLRNNTGIFSSNISNILIINSSIQQNPPSNNSNNNSNNQSNSNNNSDNNNNNNDDNTDLENASSIRITNVPETASFGSEIKITLDAYRGNTNKYAVYIYVEDDDHKKVSDKVTIHVNSKYSEYKGTLKISLACKNESGDYNIVAEGLDEKDTETISLKSCYSDEDTNNININANQNVESNAMSNNNDNNINNNNYNSNSGQSITSSNSLITGASINNAKPTTASSSFMNVLPFILGMFLFSLVGYFILKKY